MARNSTLTEDQASVPGAVPAFQRGTSSNIAYGRGEESFDKWHGRLDRAVACATLAAADDSSPWAVDTPWLQALGDTCSGHLEGERRATDSLLATLDHSLAAAYRQLASLQERRVRLTGAREQIAAQEPTPDARRVASDGADVALVVTAVSSSGVQVQAVGSAR